jgi:TonB-dependent SusC/RagA subfamily outer membrane receptor
VSGPLIIVDGTITHHGLADINSQDIDHVELVKGAAASSLYGSNAANGVIQIFTRRGDKVADGKLAVTVRNEYGQSVRPKDDPDFAGAPVPDRHRRDVRRWGRQDGQ